MHKYTQQKLPHRLLSCFTPVSKIHSRIMRLASSDFNIYQDIEHKNYKKILNMKELKFGIWYHTSQKHCHLINLK